MFEYSTIQEQNKAGKIRVSTTSRGKTLQAYNFTRNSWVSIGSVSAAVYEKQCNILKVVRGDYNPSFTLTIKELEAARDLSATFMRIINDGTTYSISLSEFEAHAVTVTNAYYGEQLACPVEYFSQIGKTKKRNKIMDSPPLPHGEGYHKPQASSLIFSSQTAQDDTTNSETIAGVCHEQNDIIPG
jgi:hypothetical protein